MDTTAANPPESASATPSAVDTTADRNADQSPPLRGRRRTFLAASGADDARECLASRPRESDDVGEDFASDDGVPVLTESIALANTKTRGEPAAPMLRPVTLLAAELSESLTAQLHRELSAVLEASLQTAADHLRQGIDERVRAAVAACLRQDAQSPLRSSATATEGQRPEVDDGSAVS